MHFRNVEQMREGGRAIITECALKGDTIAHYMDCGDITAQGGSASRKTLAGGCVSKIPEVQKVNIAFDADYASNPNMQPALDCLAETLRDAGLEVETLKWKESEGKGQRFG